MKGGTRKIAMPIPLIAPIAAPAPNPAAQPARIAHMPAPCPDHAAIMTVDETMDVIAMITPMERSSPPVRRTIMCAIDTSTR